MRAIVSVATGPHYLANIGRLLTSPYMADENVMVWKDELPPGSPSHEDSPYQFKIHAIEAAAKVGATSVMWMDSSIVPLQPLEPLWELIEKQGYWFSRNYGYNNAQFTIDESLSIMGKFKLGGMTRDQAVAVPHVVAGCFGLDMRSRTARVFLRRLAFLARQGAFKGDRGNLSGGNEPDKFYGHRNDQSCASHIAYEIGMFLTTPPDYFAEQGAPRNDNTILTVER